ncbi:MAG: hypothetical protein M0D57_12975 [Sphingobacteriales bacterium JAD_PAG50586_3]|nr:MAG: hypothetical protein M0D57_12975 [Sphingobacteriales bacterium JAD_PAG50586_3]
MRGGLYILLFALSLVFSKGIVTSAQNKMPVNAESFALTQDEPSSTDEGSLHTDATPPSSIIVTDNTHHVVKLLHQSSVLNSTYYNWYIKVKLMFRHYSSSISCQQNSAPLYLINSSIII